ncbi:MAG: NAD(P)H-hydrate dehydratase [Planctomycetota bacterium]
MPNLVLCGLPALPERPADGHKGTFGKVCLLGGSVGLSGAICLASVAALRSGSGLVTACVPRSIQLLVAAHEPCVMTRGLPDDQFGLLPPSHGLPEELFQGRHAVGCGPGLGRSAAAVAWTTAVLQAAACPLVLDADALQPELVSAFRQPRSHDCVITPHPGEFSRLTGHAMAEIERNRERLAAEFASANNVIVVLKGHRTVVTDGTRWFLNATGNSGMATGGSGDVLTGMLTSLLGQGLPAFEAAVIAVHVHGLAGDLAAARFTQRAMIASDLVACLPDAWRSLQTSTTR